MISYVPNKLVAILFYYFLRLGWRGLVNASCREIATLTYRSGLEWARRFGRARLPDEPPSLCHNFEIEQYIEYQGLQHATKLDANTLLYISKVSTSPLPLRLVAQSRYRHSFTMSHCDYTRNSKQPTVIFFSSRKAFTVWQTSQHMFDCFLGFKFEWDKFSKWFSYGVLSSYSFLSLIVPFGYATAYKRQDKL